MESLKTSFAKIWLIINKILVQAMREEKYQINQNWFGKKKFLSRIL